MNTCTLCKRISEQLKKDNSFLVQEFKHCVLYVGEHQMFEGYCVLALKQHAREMHELPEPLQLDVMKELFICGEIIQKTFKADKINYASYGNITPHIHWHIFPRKIDDVAWPNPIWTKMDEFQKHTTTEKQATQISTMIKTALNKQI